MPTVGVNAFEHVYMENTENKENTQNWKLQNLCASNFSRMTMAYSDYNSEHVFIILMQYSADYIKVKKTQLYP